MGSGCHVRQADDATSDDLHSKADCKASIVGSIIKSDNSLRRVQEQADLQWHRATRAVWKRRIDAGAAGQSASAGTGLLC